MVLASSGGDCGEFASKDAGAHSWASPVPWVATWVLDHPQAKWSKSCIGYSSIMIIICYHCINCWSMYVFTFIQFYSYWVIWLYRYITLYIHAYVGVMHMCMCVCAHRYHSCYSWWRVLLDTWNLFADVEQSPNAFSNQLWRAVVLLPGIGWGWSAWNSCCTNQYHLCLFAVD